MLRIYLLSVFTLFLLCSAKQNDLLSIKVNTNSQSEHVIATYKVEKWNKNTKLVSISITNNGEKTEFIKDVSIQLNNTPQLNTNSRILFGSFEMGKAPIVQHGINESQNTTETVLLLKSSDKNYFKTGILTWEIFRPVITWSKDKGITIFAEGENKPVKPGETVNFEKIVIESGDNWQDMLFDYGKQIANVQKIASNEIKQFKGWSTWDYYGGLFTDKEIKMNIAQLKASKIDANIIQIDGGWWTCRGDYLSTRSDIEGGMKAVAKLIAENGYTPGIHIDGFRAETEAEVFKQHPDWFLKDYKGEVLLQDYINNGKPVKRVYFDYSNPAVCDYIKNVLKTMREDWGFKYFKIDFMLYGLIREIFITRKNDTVKEIKAFDNSMTSMERTRAGLRAMKEGIGNGFFLGCSAVFGSTLGIVDGLRTGGDISPVMEFYSSRCLQNGGNFYLNKTVVQTDADYLVVRNKDDEEPNRPDRIHKYGGTVTLNEANMWANYIALFGGIKISSDNLNTLRSERKDLIHKSFSLNTCDRYIPIDFWDKATDKEDAFNIMLGSNEQGLYLALFNWKNEELGINLSRIPTENIVAVNTIEQPIFDANDNELTLTLKPRTSLLFKLNSNADFDKIRKEIKYKFN